MSHTKPVSASTKEELLERLICFMDETPIFVYDQWGSKSPAFISYGEKPKIGGYLIIGPEPREVKI